MKRDNPFGASKNKKQESSEDEHEGLTLEEALKGVKKSDKAKKKPEPAENNISANRQALMAQLNAKLAAGPKKFVKKPESDSSDMSDDEDEGDEKPEMAPQPKLNDDEIAQRNALQAQLMMQLAGKKPKALIEKEEREERERREEEERKKQEEMKKAQTLEEALKVGKKSESESNPSESDDEAESQKNDENAVKPAKKKIVEEDKDNEEESEGEPEEEPKPQVKSKAKVDISDESEEEIQPRKKSDKKKSVKVESEEEEEDPRKPLRNNLTQSLTEKGRKKLLLMIQIPMGK